MVASSILLHSPVAPVESTLSIPGSKSYTNRALILAALSRTNATLSCCSLSDDSKALLSALEKCRVSVLVSKDTIRIDSSDLAPYEGVIDVGPAGTTMRFLTSFFSVLPGADVVLSGSERMHERPIGDLVDALTSLGADISYEGTKGCPPLRIRGKSLPGGEVTLSASLSSQYVTSLLLVGGEFEQGLTLVLDGLPVSRSYIAMTQAVLRDFKREVRVENDMAYHVTPRDSLNQIHTYTCECDASGASYFFGAAALSPEGRVRINHFSMHSLQGDASFPKLLEKMGASVTEGEENGVPWVEVVGPQELHALEADMSLMPDTAQTLAVIASQAKGRTRLTGLGTLRHKETDRIHALVTELARLGVKTEAGDDWLEVEGANDVTLAPIETYDDHRMAMSFALLAFRHSGIEIRDAGVVSKSFPSYWEMLQLLGMTMKISIGSDE